MIDLSERVVDGLPMGTDYRFPETFNTAQMDQWVSWDPWALPVDDQRGTHNARLLTDLGFTVQGRNRDFYHVIPPQGWRREVHGGFLSARHMDVINSDGIVVFKVYIDKQPRNERHCIYMQRVS